MLGSITIESLLENAEALWAMVGVLGIGTISNISTFIKTQVSGKKFTKVSDFAVVADKSIKYAKKEMSDLKQEVIDTMHLQVVKPLEEEIKTLKDDNAKLAELTVIGFSLLPIPTGYKKQTVAILQGLTTVSSETIKLLTATIENEEQESENQEQENQNLNDNINNI